MSESKAVANWDEELAKYAKKDEEKVTPSNGVISLRAGVISYNGQKAPGNKLPCIVVASLSERTYYEGDYDPDNLSTPACYGFGEDGVAGPHPAASKPQSDACATCPQNRWGSALRGKGKACKEKVRLAIIPAGITDGEGVLKAEVAKMTIPVMSVKNWANYVTLVARGHRRPTFGVVTEISTEQDPKSQFVVKFDYVEDVAVDLVPALIEKRELSMEILNRPYEERAEESPKPEAKGSKHKA